MYFWAYTSQYLNETPEKLTQYYTVHVHKVVNKKFYFRSQSSVHWKFMNWIIFYSSYFVNFQSESDKRLVDKVNKLVAILGGETTIALHLEFLIRNNHADLLILKNTKVSESPQAFVNLQNDIIYIISFVSWRHHLNLHELMCFVVCVFAGCL